MDKREKRTSRPREIHVASKMLGRHNIICATISFASDHSKLGHSGFSIGIQQLCAVPDDASML
jgi:hypothetical protein